MEEFERKEDTIEAFAENVIKCFCPNCGKAVEQNQRGRRKKFCSPACTREWWKNHPKPEHWHSTAMVQCAVCGKTFLSPKELYRKRKYCSRSCANRGRKK